MLGDRAGLWCGLEGASCPAPPYRLSTHQGRPNSQSQDRGLPRPSRGRGFAADRAGSLIHGIRFAFLKGSWFRRINGARSIRGRSRRHGRISRHPPDPNSGLDQPGRGSAQPPKGTPCPRSEAVGGLGGGPKAQPREPEASVAAAERAEGPFSSYDLWRDLERRCRSLTPVMYGFGFWCSTMPQRWETCVIACVEQAHKQGRRKQKASGTAAGSRRRCGTEGTKGEQTAVTRRSRSPTRLPVKTSSEWSRQQIGARLGAVMGGLSHPPCNGRTVASTTGSRCPARSHQTTEWARFLVVGRLRSSRPDLGGGDPAHLDHGRWVNG